MIAKVVNITQTSKGIVQKTIKKNRADPPPPA